MMITIQILLCALDHDPVACPLRDMTIMSLLRNYAATMRRLCAEKIESRIELIYMLISLKYRYS